MAVQRVVVLRFVGPGVVLLVAVGVGAQNPPPSQTKKG